MRIARVRTADDSTWLARIEGDEVIPIRSAPQSIGADALRDALVAGDDLSTHDPVAISLPLEAVQLLSPLTAPSKVLAIGLNYADHAKEGGVTPPTTRSSS